MSVMDRSQQHRGRWTSYVKKYKCKLPHNFIANSQAGTNTLPRSACVTFVIKPISSA